MTEKKAVQLKVQGKCEQESLSCENFRTMDAFIRHLRVTEEKPAVLMLDYDMFAGDYSFYNWLADYKARSASGVILFSEKLSPLQRVRSMYAGADYCIGSVSDTDDWYPQVERILYWFRKVNPRQEVFRNGDLMIDYSAHTVFIGDREILLTPMEYKLLCVLARNVGQIVPHQQILKEIWGSSLESDITSLRAFMVSLRKKIESNPRKPVYIQTRVGLGYRMNRIGE